jgi:GNAT superfamily N-acetyltransferase
MRPRAVAGKALGRAQRWLSRPARSASDSLSYEITRYRPELRGQVLELQKHLWSPNLSVNAAYLSWKYEHNPYDDGTLIYLAVRGGQVIGMRTAYGTRWQLGASGEDLPAMCMGDTVVLPEYRRRGIFRGLAEFVLRELAGLGYRFAFDMSSGRIVHRGALGMGWRSVGPVEMLQRRSDGGAGNQELDPFLALDRADVRRELREGLGVSLEDAARPGEMAKLVAGRG